ncbi:hypothetical protein HOLleu_28923 [Holothuria leucospilota]|uniref:Uncharacterized protein n=1 Tax=Holothuria leucospilota TaxID=206669 RepID=A0A9Q1BMQ1_HOLLE|nr:hypothetical protein HOLleu_28923 [Holothuria leucospilota]
MLRERTLLFLVEVKGHLRSPEVKNRKLCKHDISRFVMSRGRTLLFLVEVKGHPGSPEVNLRKPRKRLVNTISRDSNDRHFSYLVYRFVMLRERTLLFLVEVKGHLRSPEVKLRKIS